MKRTLHVLLAVLMITSVLGTADAKTKHKKSKTKDTATDQSSLERMTEGLGGGADNDRPKPAHRIKREKKQLGGDTDNIVVPKPGPIPFVKPIELQLTRASSRRFDLRSLPRTGPVQQERPELPEPSFHPVTIQSGGVIPEPSRPVGNPVALAPAPPPTGVFEGLDRFNWGAGSPPDTNGDVGPNFYIQTVNTSIGIYDKSGVQQAAFTFNTLMSQGNFGNQCDTNNFGDPVVLYDTFEDRWVITDFAFTLDGGGNVNPPIAFQCFAVSMNGNPLTGGWNFYSIAVTDGLNDYPKFGIWTDGLYMSSNVFGYPAGAAFQTARVWAFNKAQMYAGSPTVKVVAFNVPGGDFAVMPSNARLQTGTPPPGRPNLFVSTEEFLNALTVYKFHADWNVLSNSTFTGPDTPLAATSWPNANVQNAGQPGTTMLLDTLQIRAMVQNQYTNFGGTESIWIPHTVRRGTGVNGLAAPRWYQADVTGGTVAANLVQGTTWDPDGANLTNRFMPSLALDRAGNMAMGYSVSSAVNEALGTSPATNCTTCLDIFPSIRYAGRLAADPINTFSQTEQTFFTGTASQTGINRWGDYSSMTLDPDGCTFWYTTEYANPADQTFNHRWLTKFGSIPAFPGCVPVGAGGTVSGTVTVNPGGAPIAGATVQLGSGRSTTTDGSGNYSFTGIPAGTYPSMTASKPGFGSASASSIVVTDGGTTTQNFSLTAAPASACLTDTTQADFQTGVPTNVDLNASPGDVKLANPPVVGATNQTLIGSGFSFTTAWHAQTFTATASGPVVRVDLNLFSLDCSATVMPPVTISIRNAAGNLPTGADLATATIPGFCNGAGGYFTANFAAPATLVSGTQYALVWRTTLTNASVSGQPRYVSTISGSPTGNPYAGGQGASSTNSGASWTARSAANNDHGFIVYFDNGFTPSGNLVSSPKDANPAGGFTPIWSTFSWNGATPANTSLQFQLAGSNNVNGPFSFVGPDGTAGSFFTTSPVQLSPQFYNFRFLEYKALLATTSSAVTPTLNDATFCFNDTDCSSTVATITPAPASVCSSSAGNSASGPAGMTSYAWGITNGTITSATNIQMITYTAGASGTVTLSLTVTAPNGCIVSGSAPVTINPLPTTPTISGTLTFCAGSNTTLTSDSATGNQWYLGGNPIAGQTNQNLIVTAAGSYTVQVTDGNGCTSAMSAPAVVSQNNPPPVPTIAGTTNGTGTQDQACPEVPLTLTATSAGATSFQWYKDIDLLPGETNATYQATGAATYYVTATVNGCTSVQSAGYVVQNPTPHSPFISFRGQDSSVTTLNICQGTSQIIDSDSATGIQWYRDGSPIAVNGNSQSYTATGLAPGTYVFTAQLNALGCHSQFGRNVTLIVDAMPPTPTISGDTNGTGTQDQACPEQPLTLHANGATGATSYTWYSDNAVIPNESSSTLIMTGVGNISVTATNGTCTTPHSATYVVQNPTPHAPFITIRTQASTTTSISICQGSSIILDSDSATGIQWWKDGSPLTGPQAQSLTISGLAPGTYTYTAQLNALGCHSQFGRNITVTVNALPATPTATPGGPTTFCTGGSVTLTSSSASGNQWFLNGNPIGGATNQTYPATATGSYTVKVTDGNSCTSAASNAVSVTVNPLPATPTITPGGPTTFCAGGSVTLTSSAASGNQWFLNGNPIGGATNTTFPATASGSYTVKTTDVNSCTSAASAATVVTVNANPNATITAPASVTTSSTGNVASVANAGAGATYAWSITNGTITGGNNTPSITFTAGAAPPGTLTINLTVTNAAGCSDTKSAIVNRVLPVVTVTSVSPNFGTVTGGTSVTINGTNFAAGATVTFGGTAATNVVVVSAIKITAKTPAHAAGAVNVTVTNTDTSTGTATNGYSYQAQVFDPNGDGVIDPADIFFLINYLFTGGPPPHGPAGILSGDANGDGVVDPADIFYLVNFLFLGGQKPNFHDASIHGNPGAMAVGNAPPEIAGSVTLGTPVLRAGHYFIPVMMTSRGSAAPQSLSLKLHVSGDAAVGDVIIRRAGAAKDVPTVFETSRRSGNDVSYLVAYDPRGISFDESRSAVVAEIEIAGAGANMSVSIDPALTMLSNQAGTSKATVTNGHLEVRGTAARGDSSSPRPRTPGHEVN